MSKITLSRKLAVRRSKKITAKKVVTDKDVKTVADLTDRNNHAEAAFYIANNVLKNKRLGKAWTAFITIRDHFNSVSELREVEIALRKQLKANMEMDLSESDFEKLYHAM